MGMKLFSDGTTTAPNPDPSRFKILSADQIGTYAVVLVHYPGCTTFEGNKVLLFESTLCDDLFERSTLDPHFFESDESPIARFPGDLIGLKRAREVARYLCLLHQVREG